MDSLEGTNEFNRGFRQIVGDINDRNGASLDPMQDRPLYENWQRILRERISQSIENEEYYPHDPIGQEDFMLERLTDLIEENAVEPEEADRTFNEWITKRRPGTVILTEPRSDDEHDWPEIQGEYIDPDWAEQLDEYSKTYHPFQEIVPDVQTGFSIDGNYHAVQNFTLDGLSQAITPFKWRDYLQDAITQLVSTYDYTVGANERYQIAEDIVAQRMESLDSNLERLQLDKALELWKESYGRGYRINET